MLSTKMRQLLPINCNIDANTTGHCNNHPPTVGHEEACTCCPDIIANASDAAAAAGAGTAAVLRLPTLPLLLPHQPTASQPPGAGVACMARVIPGGMIPAAAPCVAPGCNTAGKVRLGCTAATWVHHQRVTATATAAAASWCWCQPWWAYNRCCTWCCNARWCDARGSHTWGCGARWGHTGYRSRRSHTWYRTWGGHTWGCGTWCS